MGLRLAKGSILVVLIIVLLLCMHASCKEIKEAASSRPKKTTTTTSGDFVGFLPRSMPVPPSAPSKRHNSIGLSGRRTPRT
ncbi:hypothetical protein Cni_G27587 [Canna indica]|uniref:Uncharacterized protein n=1 Tax=Canna indica TaxID=4628 RepID=A0AAQ3L1P2_9LILI|nr:hypothetical protein Cni_G27587 [Canna indica]